LIVASAVKCVNDSNVEAETGLTSSDRSDQM
jgi:hypothetical protein